VGSSRNAADRGNDHGYRDEVMVVCWRISGIGSQVDSRNRSVAILSVSSLLDLAMRGPAWCEHPTGRSASRARWRRSPGGASSCRL